MTLIPVEHEHRLASPAEAEACFRAFGERSVSVRGFRTTDMKRFARVVEAIEPKREHTISFEGGTLGSTSWDGLDALAVSRFQYLDIRTADANLRIWPERHTWVHASRAIEVVAAAMGSPLVAGENVIGDTKLTLAMDDRHYPVDVETKSIATALRLFRALSVERVDRGFISGVAQDTKPPLVQFLALLGATFNAVLEIDVAEARALTDLFSGETLDWQAGGLLVDFPEGRLNGYLVTPNATDRDREKWKARVTKALRKAGLG